MTPERKKEFMDVSKYADTLWRAAVENERLNGTNEVGATKKKLIRFDALNKTSTTTNSMGRVSAVKRKKTLDYMLTKEQHNLLAHFLLGDDWTEEQRTEAILSLGSVLPGALATMDGGECLVCSL